MLLPFFCQSTCLRFSMTQHRKPLIEYNINIFLETSYTKCGEELFPHPFLKNQNWECLWINCLKFYTVLEFRAEDYHNILKLSSRLLAFTSYKAFGQQKEVVNEISQPHFPYDFWR